MKNHDIEMYIGKLDTYTDIMLREQKGKKCSTGVVFKDKLMECKRPFPYSEEETLPEIQ